MRRSECTDHDRATETWSRRRGLDAIDEILQRSSVGDTVNVTYTRGDRTERVDVKLRPAKLLNLELDELEKTLEKKISPWGGDRRSS